MADGSRLPIEQIKEGDRVMSLDIPGMVRDSEELGHFDWNSFGMEIAGARVVRGTVSRVKKGTHDGFYVINGRLKATFEHPILINEMGHIGWCSVDRLRVGQEMMVRNPDGGHGWEPVVSVTREFARVGTVAITVPGINTYVADGVWAHNTSSSGSSGSGSSGGTKVSGSSSDGSGGSISGSVPV